MTPPSDSGGDAMRTVTERFDIKYWARSGSDYVRLRKLSEAYNNFTFHGMPVKPVAINQSMWEILGSPSRTGAPVVLTSSAGGRQFCVVEVSASANMWESPTFFVDYDAWVLTKASSSQGSGSTGADPISGPADRWDHSCPGCRCHQTH